MYLVTSKLNGKRVCLAQGKNNKWYWTDKMIDAKYFKTVHNARHAWITHRHLVPRTEEEVTIDELVLNCKETLE